MNTSANVLASSSAPLATGAQAILHATDWAMTQDSKVIVMGEGATDPKGIFGTTVGLAQKFGPSRVLEMPLSENGWTGIAIGAAMTGLRPIIVHQRVEFSLLSLEQLFNQAAKAHYVSAGAHRVPLVVRVVVGRGWGQGPMHAQSLESVFCAIPGLKVMMPSTPAQAFDLLCASIQDPNPVVFIEHRWVHQATGALPENPSDKPLRGSQVLAKGEHATVVASSYMTLETQQAVQALAERGCSVDFFDLPVLSPLDLEDIVASVQKTGRLLCVDTGHKSHGVGAEICARVTERCFHALKAAPMRVGLPGHPVPSSAKLAQHFYPRSPQICSAIAQLCDLSSSKQRAAIATLERTRADFPLDVPHPSFKGPF